MPVYINLPFIRIEKVWKIRLEFPQDFVAATLTTGSVTVTSLSSSSSSSLVENTRGTETKREKIYFCIFWITLPEAAPSAAFRHLIGAFNFPFIRMQPSPRATQRLTCKSDVSFFYEPACPLIIEFVEKFWTFPFHIYKFLVTNTILNPHIIYTYIYIVIRYILRIP